MNLRKEIKMISDTTSSIEEHVENHETYIVEVRRAFNELRAEIPPGDEVIDLLFASLDEAVKDLEA